MEIAVPDERETEGRVLTGLTKFAPDEWFTTREGASFWLRVYSTLFISHEAFFQASKQAVKDFTIDAPVHAEFVHFAKLKFPSFTWHTVTQPEGDSCITMVLGNASLPASIYYCLATPLPTPENPNNPELGRRVLDPMAALIVANVGRNFMRDLVFEAEVQADSGTFSNVTEAIAVPKPCEGPFLSTELWQDISELTKRLAIFDPDIKGRILLALEFFTRAVRAQHPFFEYWTALELVCGGKSQRIKERLKECYGMSNVGAVDKIGFGVVAQWRHRFFHKGARPSLSADVQRYLQLMFLDLLRRELNFPAKLFVPHVIEAAGYDFRSIGLRDNRTPEQLEAEKRLREGNSGSDNAA